MIIARREPRIITIEEIGAIIEHNWGRAKVSEDTVELRLADFHFKLAHYNHSQGIEVDVKTTDRTLRWKTWCGGFYHFEDRGNITDQVDEATKAILITIGNQVLSKLQ